tara:strand:- start:216 stop:689 length:474 start_codon:yes stop_codon:yes gene_type:complete
MTKIIKKVTNGNGSIDVYVKGIIDLDNNFKDGAYFSPYDLDRKAVRFCVRTKTRFGESYGKRYRLDDFSYDQRSISESRYKTGLYMSEEGGLLTAGKHPDCDRKFIVIEDGSMIKHKNLIYEVKIGTCFDGKFIREVSLKPVKNEYDSPLGTYDCER